MDDDLKRKASGRTLEILKNMWKSECEKEEKKSLDKWRYKEIWLLDYVRRYGNNTTKEKESKQRRETAHKRDDHQRQKITQVTLGTKANLKQARICLQQWIQVIMLHPAKKLFDSNVLWLTIEKINHILLIPMRENNHGTNRWIEEITKVQEMKILQKIVQSIGTKNAMSEDTFIAGIMCATLTGQHI